MPFAPIDQAVKDETVKLVQQNMSLTQIADELHKRGRNVSRSWIANIARKYKKSKQTITEHNQERVPSPLLQSVKVAAAPTSQPQPQSQSLISGTSQPSNNKITLEGGALFLSNKGLSSSNSPLSNQHQELELLSQHLDQRQQQLDLRQRLQDQRQQELGDYDNSIKEKERQAAAQLKAHQRKEAFLESRFQDLLARENCISKYENISMYIDEIGFAEEEILDFFSMVRNRAEDRGMSNRAVLVKIIEEFNDEDDVSRRLQKANQDLAAANQNLMFKYIMMSQ